jgi:predicted small lipoprotein YifL
MATRLTIYGGCLVLILAACGQKGPLVLPQPESPESAAEAAQPDPKPEQ